MPQNPRQPHAPAAAVTRRMIRNPAGSIGEAPGSPGKIIKSPKANAKTAGGHPCRKYVVSNCTNFVYFHKFLPLGGQNFGGRIVDFFGKNTIQTVGF